MTAVEWLIEQLNKNENIRWRGAPVSELTEQAKAMEKKQMIKFTEDWYNEYMDRTPERLYNETYNK